MEFNKDEPSAMLDWDFSPENADKMQDAKDRFAHYVSNLPNVQKDKIKKHPGLARQIFAERGPFYLEEQDNLPRNAKPIPLDAEFRILDWRDMEGRENLITLVLREGQSEDAKQAEIPDYYKIWQCTYNPYAQRKTEEIRHREEDSKESQREESS
jgi:hypothetical protein